MSTLDDGGPAFPATRANYDEDGYCTPGMSLRDYIAIHASIDDIREFMLGPIVPSSRRSRLVVRERIHSRAEARYAYADTMMMAGRAE